MVASWKCWSRAVGDNRLRWELRRTAPSCGFIDKSKHTIVSRQISWNWSRWEGVLCSSGLQPAEHMGQSRRALQRLREADDDDEQEHWCSSEGVLTLLLYWSAHRKAVCHRMLAELWGCCWLEKCVPAETVFRGGDPWKPPPSVPLCCQVAPIQGTHCACLSKALGEVGRPEYGTNTPQGFLFLQAAWLRRDPLCKACALWASMLVTEAARSAEEHIEMWADFKWHKGGAAILQGLAKRRRIDPHVKEYVMRVAPQVGSAASAAMAVRSLDSVDRRVGFQWMMQDCCALQASQRLSFGIPGAHALCFDASRIGKPARDYLLVIASDLRKERCHAVLAPQAPWFCKQREVMLFVAVSKLVCSVCYFSHNWSGLGESHSGTRMSIDCGVLR